MWELDHKESWVLKNWCFQIMVLEKTLESPLDCKGIKPVNPKGNQPWIFIGKSDAEAEAPILWPPDGTSQLTGKIEGKTRIVHQRMSWLDSITHSANYKSALAKSICQRLNNKGIFHPPLQRLNPLLLQLQTFNSPWGEFRVESEAPCALGNWGNISSGS